MSQLNFIVILKGFKAISEVFFFSSPGSRRPSILPVPDMFTSSSFSIAGNDDGEEGDESDDEIDDEMPWRSPSEKIA